MRQPYVFQEWPKWVTPKTGVPVVVENKEEEETLMGYDPIEVEPLNEFQKPRGRPPGSKNKPKE